MRILWTHKYILDIFEKHYRKYLEQVAKKKLREQKDLWRDLCEYQDRTISSGASYSDYWLLYQYIRSIKPKEVLECGTGVTTIIIAHAIRDNDTRDKVRGRVTSMEDIEKCYHGARELVPKHLEKYVDIVLSPKVEDVYCIFRGVRYKDVPERSYEFVFIDGPGTHAPSDGCKTFDFDFIRVVEKSDIPVYAFVDTRMSTCWVLAHVFQKGKVAYDYRYNVGIIGPCTKNDLLSTNGIVKEFGPHPVARGTVGSMFRARGSRNTY